MGTGHAPAPAGDIEHEVLIAPTDMRRCMCGRSISIIAGKLRHVSAEEAAADRAHATIKFTARVGPKGVNVTVEGDGEPNAPLSVSLDGQMGRQEAGGRDGSPDEGPGG